MCSILVRLVLLYLVLSLSSCKSYELVPKGYMVQGYEYFVNLEENLGVYLGDDFRNSTIWAGNKPPMAASKLSRGENRLLKKLGYNMNAYAVIFKNVAPLDYQVITLVNTQSVSRGGKEKLLELGRMQRQVTDGSNWFYERIEGKNSAIYHAVVPVSEKLFEEKYLSFIYILPDTHLYTEMERIVETNVSKYKRPYSYYLKTVEDCPDEEEVRHYEYLIPEEITNAKAYMILKAVDKMDRLVYYTLLNPGIHIGAFRICSGSYSLQYTTLDGEIVWQEEIII